MDASTKGDGRPGATAVGLRYMAEFRCLGPECPDNCCQSGWVIHFDRKAYKRLRQAMDHAKPDREKFRAAMQRNGSPSSDADYARVDFGGGHTCPFFGQDGLCEVHRRFGDNHLGTVCRSYPRKLNARPGVRELSGYLSCPASARACLTDDQGLDLVQVTADVSGLPVAALARGGEDAQEFLDEIREVAFSVLDAREMPLAERLLLLGYLAQRLDAHGPLQQLSPTVLAAEVDRISALETRQAVCGQLRAADPDLSLPMSLLQTVLLAKRESAWQGFRELLAACWRGYASMQPGAGMKLELGGGRTAVQATELAAEYRALRERADALYGARLDDRLARWAMNHWFQTWFLKAPSMTGYVQDLVVRYAIIRFLTVSHPAVRQLVEAEAPPEAAADTLDEAAIEVVYRFSRAVEHNQKFLTDIREAIEAEGLSGLALQLLLLRV